MTASTLSRHPRPTVRPLASTVVVVVVVVVVAVAVPCFSPICLNYAGSTCIHSSSLLTYALYIVDESSPPNEQTVRETSPIRNEQSSLLARENPD